MSAILHDEHTESALLGCALVFNQALDDMVEVLEPSHFGRAHHAAIYRAMLTLHRAGKPVDPLSLIAEVEAQGDGKVVSKAEVYGLETGAVRLSNVPAHCERVRDAALLRELRQHARDLIAEVEAEGARASAVLEDASSRLFALSHQATRSDWISGSELASRVYEAVEQLGSGQKVSGLPTGFAELDNMTRGMQRGDLILVGARPSMGKTAFALQVALHAAKSVPVAFFSVEMAADPIGMRAVINAAQVDGFRLMSGWTMSQVDYQRIAEGTSTLANASLFIDESPQLSPVKMRSKLRRLRAKTGTLGLVVVDYLQLLEPMPEHKRENKTNQVAGISRALKVLAREMSVPFVVLSQLNRGTEHKAEKRPSMSDLRDSGALEQDADVVLLLHRPNYYDANQPADLAEVVVAKQRNGPTGIVNLSWVASHMRFGNGTGRVA